MLYVNIAMLYDGERREILSAARNGKVTLPLPPAPPPFLRLK